MGVDIHSLVEVKTNGKWVIVKHAIFDDYGDIETAEFFEKRNYAVFGFLADVRNYSCCQPICEPKGFPDDSEYLNSSIYGSDRNIINDLQEDSSYHSRGWLTLKELLDFDYEQKFWNKRPVFPNQWNNQFLVNEGEGQPITYRKHLGEGFFKDIEVLKTLGNPEDVRIIFWFND